MIEKIKGLVIKVKNINENDKYLTVLCEEYGKISFKAAGVRNYKSKNIAAAQLFAYSEFTLFKTPAFIRMNEAQILESFYGIRLDLASLALAVYLSDIASVICVGESMDDGQILRLLLNTLHIISNKKMPNKITKAVFELRTLTKSGFMPNLEECEICSREVFDSGNIMFFDVIGGNLICEDCVVKSNQTAAAGESGEREYSEWQDWHDWNNKSQRKLVRVSYDLLRVLRFVTTVRDEKLFSFALHDDVVDEFSRVCEKYLLEQIGMNIDSLKYYKSYEK